MRIMGLDLSLSGTGLAVLDEHLEPVHLERISTTTKDGSTVERSDYIATIIGERVEKFHPECIVIEEYAFSKSGSKLGELGGIVKRQLWITTGVSECWITAASTSVKKLVTGSGHASKEDMIAEVNAQLNLTMFDRKVSHDNNVCDALGLCLWAADKIA